MPRAILIRRRSVAAAMVTLLVGACNSGGGDTANPSPILTVRDSFDGGMDALTSGRLTIRDGCVFLVYDNLTKAVVWPTGTRLVSAEDALELADGRTLPNGASLEIDGGSVPYAEALTTFASDPSSEAKACAERADLPTVFVADSDPSAVSVL